MWQLAAAQVAQGLTPKKVLMYILLAIGAIILFVNLPAIIQWAKSLFNPPAETSSKTSQVYVDPKTGKQIDPTKQAGSIAVGDIAIQLHKILTSWWVSDSDRTKVVALLRPVPQNIYPLIKNAYQNLEGARQLTMDLRDRLGDEYFVKINSIPL